MKGAHGALFRYITTNQTYFRKLHMQMGEIVMICGKEEYFG